MHIRASAFQVPSGTSCKDGSTGIGKKCWCAPLKKPIESNAMNVLFITSSNDVGAYPQPLQTLEQMQFGIASISSVLKQNGHVTQLLLLSKTFGSRNQHLLRAALRDFEPRLICFSAVATEFAFCRLIADSIKAQFPSIFLVIGGPHVSLNPQECYTSQFDALCIGEGEHATVSLASAIAKREQPAGIANLWFRSGSTWEKNPPGNLIEDLDSLPLPDRDMWLPLVIPPVTRTSVLMGRGCPYTCTYCCNHALKKIAPGRYVRFRSPAAIVSEIDLLTASLPHLQEVYLEVETVQANLAWFEDVCNRLADWNGKGRQRVTFGTNWRIAPGVECDRPFKSMKAAGFRFVNIGLESGSSRLRQEVLNRRYSNRDVFRTVRSAKANGLQVCLYNMMGLPGETRRDFFKTVAVNRHCATDMMQNSIFYPYPGTALHRLASEKGLVVRAVQGLERRTAVAFSDQFTKKEIERGFLWFCWLVHRRRKSLLRILLVTSITWVTMHERCNRVLRSLLRYRLFNRLKGIVKK